MDDQLIALNDKVASAAEAWLADPSDVHAYGRLVTAVRERRAYLQPTLDVLPDAPATPRRPAPTAPPEHTPTAEPPVAEQPDELADHRPVQRLGTALAGQDPRQVLARLRGAVNPSCGLRGPAPDGSWAPPGASPRCTMPRTTHPTRPKSTTANSS